MMHFAVIFAALTVVIVALVVVTKIKSAGVDSGAKKDCYYLRPSIVTPAERSFLGVLQILNYEGVTFVTKIRISDVVGVRKGLEMSDRRSALNRIQSKHVDFLLVQESDGKPVLAIELDDSSHDDPSRVARDRFVDEVFRSVGLPIIHIRAQASYDPKSIHASIQQAISQKG